MEALQNLKKTSEKFFNFFFAKEFSEAIEQDTRFEKRDGVWAAYVHKDVPKAQLKDFFCSFVMAVGYKIQSETKATLIAVIEDVDANNEVFLRRKIELSIGFTEHEERIMLAKLSPYIAKQTEQNRDTYFEKLFDEFANHLASNNMLRSQRFDPKSVSTVHQLRENATLEQEKRELQRVVTTNTVLKENLFAIFLNEFSSGVKEVLQQYASSRSMTCKLEGKSIIKAASSSLSVTMKLGFNERNERILHIHNEVSHLGGDKTGDAFREFCRGLVVTLTKGNYLQSQEGKEDYASEFNQEM